MHVAGKVTHAESVLLRLPAADAVAGVCRRVDTRAGFSMHVYPTHDVVSGYLANPNRRQWEQDEIQQVRYALNKQLPVGAQLTSSSSDVPPLFIDVGANVGVFTLNIAKTGARVYAFEGESNSSCSYPALKQMSVCDSTATAAAQFLGA